MGDSETFKAIGLPGESDYDWPEVFKYASGYGKPFWVLPAESKDTSREPANAAPAPPFDLADVERVDAAVEGDNDGPDWLVFGLLKDGRWFSISAGCDYTGWG